MDPTKQHIPNQATFTPPFNANVSPFSMLPNWSNWQVQPGPAHDASKMFNDSKIEPKILAKAAEWTEHRGNKILIQKKWIRILMFQSF